MALEEIYISIIFLKFAFFNVILWLLERDISVIVKVAFLCCRSLPHVFILIKFAFLQCSCMDLGYKSIILCEVRASSM